MWSLPRVALDKKGRSGVVGRLAPVGSPLTCVAKRLEQKVNNKNFIVSVVFPWVDSDFIKPLMRSENPIAHNYLSDDGLVILPKVVPSNLKSQF